MSLKTYIIVVCGIFVGFYVFLALSAPLVLSDLLPEYTYYLFLVLGAVIGGICAKPISRVPQLYKRSEMGLPLSSLLAHALKIFVSVVIIFCFLGVLLGALLSPITIIGLGNVSSQTEPLNFTLTVGFLSTIPGGIIGFIVGFGWLISQP